MPVAVHNRHTVRLPGYDDAQPGGYFVTIVTHGRECALGTVVDGNVALSDQGLIVQKARHDLPQHFTNVMLDEFVIMPNHVHGILEITDGDGGFRSNFERRGAMLAQGRAGLCPEWVWLFNA